MNGVYHSNGTIVACDGFILVQKKEDYPAEKEGKTIGRNGAEIEGRYPNAEKVLSENTSSMPSVDLDAADLEQWCSAAAEQTRQARKRSGNSRQRFYRSVTVLKVDDRYAMFDTEKLYQFAQAAVEIGATKLHLSESGELYAEGNKGRALLMSLTLVEGEYFVPCGIYSYKGPGRAAKSNMAQQAKPHRLNAAGKGEIDVINQVKSATDNVGAYDASSDDIRFSIGRKPITDFTNKELDKAYFEALDGNDMDYARQLVDEAARRAGYTDTEQTTIAETTKTVAAELQGKFGTEAEVIEGLDDVQDAEARKRIAAGEAVKGWYDPKTGKVYLYAPNLESEQDAMATYAHEVIAHKGMEGLLGKERYAELCKRLGEALTPEQRKLVKEYAGSGSRTLGDEYIARIAETLIDEQGNIK